VAPSLLSVAGGSYLQGDGRGGGRASRQVTVADFEVSAHCVTTQEWAVTRSAAPAGYTIGAGAVPSDGWDSLPTPTQRTLPVVGVTLFDVAAWCNARSEIDGLTPAIMLGGSVYLGGAPGRLMFNLSADGYRPPTEPEWEFAARSRGVRPGDEQAGAHDGRAEADVANFAHLYPLISDVGRVYDWVWGGRGKPRVLPVDALQPNDLGLYHCSGNVWEWTCTSWDGRADYDEPEHVPLRSRQVVIRGGSIRARQRPNDRQAVNVTFALADLGLRVARSPTSPALSGRGR